MFKYSNNNNNLLFMFFFFCSFDIMKNNHKNVNKNSTLVKQSRINVRIFKKKLFSDKKRDVLRIYSAQSTP